MKKSYSICTKRETKLHLYPSIKVIVTLEEYLWHIYDEVYINLMKKPQIPNFASEEEAEEWYENFNKKYNDEKQKYNGTQKKRKHYTDCLPKMVFIVKTMIIE